MKNKNLLLKVGIVIGVMACAASIWQLGGVMACRCIANEYIKDPQKVIKDLVEIAENHPM